MSDNFSVHRSQRQGIGEITKKEEAGYHIMEEKSEMARNFMTPLSIKKINVSDFSYEQLDKMLFHYTWKCNVYSINENGLQATVGINSDGIDNEPSIFFSNGVEAVLQTWDVWLKWRLNRMNNPLWQGQTKEENKELQEKFKNGLASDEQYRMLEQWTSEYLSGEYKADYDKLQKLYEYQFSELRDSIYLSLNLKEGEDYKVDQVDHKKQNNFLNKDNPNSQSYGFFRVMYGDYTDYDTEIVDKWNMQTIPGKNITVPTYDLAQLVTSDGKDDVWSIVNEFYQLYKNNIPSEQQCQFDLLDDFVVYACEKEKKEIQYSDETQELINQAQSMLGDSDVSNFNYENSSNKQIGDSVSNDVSVGRGVK